MSDNTLTARERSLAELSPTCLIRNRASAELNVALVSALAAIGRAAESLARLDGQTAAADFVADARAAFLPFATTPANGIDGFDGQRETDTHIACGRADCARVLDHFNALVTRHAAAQDSRGYHAAEADIYRPNADGSVTLITPTGGHHTYDPADMDAEGPDSAARR